MREWKSYRVKKKTANFAQCFTNFVAVANDFASVFSFLFLIPWYR